MSFHTGAPSGSSSLSAQSDVGDPAWIWTDGGSHFGVPLQNYAGWMLTAFIVFALFRWLEPRLPERPWRGARSRVFAWLPVGGYGGMAVVDAWLGYPEIRDIHLVSPFAMGIPALFASVQIFTNRQDWPLWPVDPGKVSS